MFARPPGVPARWEQGGNRDAAGACLGVTGWVDGGGGGTPRAGPASGLVVSDPAGAVV